MAQIALANVTFVMPKGDDRDSNTGIAVRVCDAQGNIIVWNNNVAPDKPFSDPGTYGPYGLTIINADASETDFSFGSTQLLISPVGHDRWITNVLIALHWDNGNGRTCQSHTIIVDQDVNSATWSNSQVTMMQSIKIPALPLSWIPDPKPKDERSIG